MRTSAILLVLAVTTVICCNAESSPAARRDEAVRKIDACLRRNEVSSRHCKKLNQNVQVLVDAYRGGDKSVLPVLLKFTYLTEFYDEALLNDPDGFLAAVNQLPEKARKEVAIGVAGGYFRRLTEPRFAALRALLTGVPQSSPIKSVAQECLQQLETNNASLFLNYFPPQTFTGRTADFQTFWYSRDLYALGEQPLWSPVSSGVTYRFTHLGTFTGPKSATLTVLPDGTGTVTIKALNPSRDKQEMDESRAVSAEQVSRFLSTLAKADYWNVPTELPARGLDGAEWILEGRQSGQYHVVVRWCPGTGPRDPEVLAFADAARLLLEFSGHKYKGGC
ncbi:MAG TPA: hypothetical protein VHW72_05510 [Candidatus Angelobacter sp.]|jgi:hypothetical protein|nr:hypothetical protein [Candidatus Angelobacter sp.]